MQDLALARRLVAGEESAFDAFFADYFPRVYRFARARLDGNDDWAEDVTQAALIKALAKIHTYRGDAALFTWLCTLCRHEISDWRQRSGRASEVALVDDSPDIRAALETVAALASEDPDAALRRRELSRLVQATLDHLPGRTAISQRMSVVSHAFGNQTQAEQPAGRGSASALAYRADVARVLVGGLFEAGTQVQQFQRREGIRHDTTWMRSAYAHFTWTPTPRLKVAPGLRVADSTSAQRPAVSPWILTEWSLGPNWTVRASTGRSHQFAGTEPVGPVAGAPLLGPERATHVDVGIGHRLAPSVRWQATWFARRERDVVREPDDTSWLVSTPTEELARLGRFRGRLAGTSQGVELRLERQRPTGLSGWAAYSYGRTRYTDPSRDTLRSGSNFPIPGYLVERDAGLFLGSHPNDVRLPPYARLDVRATRTFRAAGRRVMLFVDVVNVLNRTNIGLANGVIRPGTGEAIGFTETLFPRLPTAGLVVEF